MKRLAKKLLGQLGYQVVKKQPAVTPRTPNPTPADSVDAIFSETIAALRRCKARGLQPATVIDVGAAAGWWTQAVRRQVWPESNYLLVEPLEERKETLTALVGQSPQLHYVQAGAGAREGNVTFVVSEDLDGSGVYDNAPEHSKRTVRIISLDDEVRTRGLTGPYCIKLDTHGYEVPILEGAKHMLPQTELLVIECYGFQIASQSLLFWQMCEHMYQLGFRLADIIDIMRRNKDGAFWQCDAVFIPVNSPIFLSNSYA